MKNLSMSSLYLSICINLKSMKLHNMYIGLWRQHWRFIAYVYWKINLNLWSGKNDSPSHVILYRRLLLPNTHSSAFSFQLQLENIQCTRGFNFVPKILHIMILEWTILHLSVQFLPLTSTEYEITGIEATYAIYLLYI